MKSNIPAAIDTEETDFQMRHHRTDQPSLFPTEDLIIPDTLRHMRKAVSAIHATPIKAEHSQTLNSRRLFDACILVAQIDFRKRDKSMLERVRADRIAPLFETHITDLARLAGIPGKNYERIYAEMDKLFEMVLRWNIVGEGQEVQWEMKSHFLSSLGYGRAEKKRGLVRFSLDPSILEIVLEPSNWATLSLEIMQGLGTSASYALYQNAWRYVNTHAKVTAILPTETWIELLLGASRYVEDDGKGGKVAVNYGDFKRRVLTDAMRRVNEIPALSHTLELKEYRSGNRVAKLQFKFLAKQQPSLGLPLTWPADLLQVLESIGFTDTDVENLAQAHSYEEVAETIVRLKAAEVRLRAQGRQISSRRAYFNGILANIASGASPDGVPDEAIEAQARQQEAVRAAAAREERRRDEFARHQADVFAKKLFQMADATRQEMVGAFEASEAGVKARLLTEKGWTAKNVGALSMLRNWLAAERPEALDQMLSPEDKSYEAWMAWRLDQPPADSPE